MGLCEKLYRCNFLELNINCIYDFFVPKSHYVKLEIRSDKNKNLAEYVKTVVEELKSKNSIQLINITKGEVDHFFALSGFLAFNGYIIRIKPKVDLKSLKESCMQLELDSEGNRVADIDVYYNNKKITRKKEKYGL